MVILISGASHSGKTYLAHRLVEKYKYSCLSIDHLKMGLIRSKNTDLTPLSDDSELTDYLWPIVREMIKTAVENNQDLIVEGCYIPFDWQKDFEKQYRDNIRYICLILSEEYIKTRFDDIIGYAGVIEKRLGDSCDMDGLVGENNQNLALAKKYNLNYLLIEGDYIEKLNSVDV